MFAEEGVSHPLGIEHLTSADDLACAIAEMRAQKPGIRKVVVKLNEGVSGEGNAHLDLQPLAGRPSIDEVRAHLDTLKFESSEMHAERYFELRGRIRVRQLPEICRLDRAALVGADDRIETLGV